MRFRSLKALPGAIAPHLRSITVRIVHSALTLWAVTIVFFAIAELMPGDFATATATRDTTREEIVQTRYELGLYVPALDRYVNWMAGIVQGDLGISWWTRKPITPLIADRLLHSGWLVGWATLVTIPIGLALAIMAVVWRNGVFDRVSSAAALAAISFPEFIVGYSLMALLAVYYRIFPVHTIFSDEMSVLERLYVSALPILSLAAVTIVPVFRQSRAALINVLSAAYIEMARLKGLKQWRIVVWHALPNAIGPIANGVLMAIGNLFFGLVIIEMVFAYPGLGYLLINAVQYHDIPLVLACSLITAALYVGLNLLADVAAAVWNPKLQFSATPGVTLWRLQKWGRMLIRRWPVFASLSVVLIAAGFTFNWIQQERRYAVDVQISVPLPQTEMRDRLTVEELHTDLPRWSEPIHYNYFKPFGPFEPAQHRFEGNLHVPVFTAKRRRAGDRTITRATKFPDFSTAMVTDGNILLPVQRDRLLISSSGSWYLIISPGRVWHEPADGDWSRGAFPFSLMSTRSYAVHYGVATFLYNHETISQVRFQVSQETANWAQFDIWGQAPANYTPTVIPEADQARSAYRRVLESRVNMKPWSELSAKHWRSLEAFDGEGNRENVAVSGLMMDDTFYLRNCRTRAGPHPFCREMRYGVFSISKSLGAGIGMLWLAQKYGPQVFDERLVDYIDIPARHDGWKDVTFRNALDMTTGIGNIMPYIVDEYVEVDSSEVANRVWRARSIQDKLDAMARFNNYPWKPGKVTRYRSSDTTALAAAMEAYLRRQEGSNADLWDSLTREVFLPLGIDRIPVRRTFEPDGRRGTPMLAAGMYVTIDEALKLARLYQDHGVHNGKQLLHRELTARAVSVELERGFRTGWRTPTEGREGNYEMSFWLNDHPPSGDCDVRIPGMSGYGGNYLMVMPNRTIGLRFADGHDDDVHTWDSYGIRSISERIRPFCE